MHSPKDRIHFILSHTQFASNLGAAARVMKNMGFSRLILIRPQCEVGMEARAMAMKGADVLDRARLEPNLAEVAKSLDLVVGTTGRFDAGKPRWTTSRAFCEQILPRYPGRIGIAFGAEDSGLQRDEIKLCHWLVEVPTDSDYPVLNLSQAVGIVAYDLNLAISPAQRVRPPFNVAGEQELEALLKRVERSLDESPHVSRERLMGRLRKLLGRAQLEKEDVQMLHGLLCQRDPNPS